MTKAATKSAKLKTRERKMTKLGCKNGFRTLRLAVVEILTKTAYDFCSPRVADNRTEISFFVSKQCTILPISTKFQHNTSIGVAMNSVGTEF